MTAAAFGTIYQIGKRDKIHYTIRPDGEVVLTRAARGDEDDPLLGQFLSFLAQDIASHPDRLQSVDTSLVQRIQSLVGSIEVDLDTALSAAHKHNDHGTNKTVSCQKIGRYWHDLLAKQAVS